MPNNDWYEYTSEEMQHLGEEPGDVLSLIMCDRKPGSNNVRSRKRCLPRAQENKLATPAPVRDKLLSPRPAWGRLFPRYWMGRGPLTSMRRNSSFNAQKVEEQ